MGSDAGDTPARAHSVTRRRHPRPMRPPLQAGLRTDLSGVPNLWRLDEAGVKLTDEATRALASLPAHYAEELVDSVAAKSGSIHDPSNYIACTVARGFESRRFPPSAAATPYLLASTAAAAAGWKNKFRPRGDQSPNSTIEVAASPDNVRATDAAAAPGNTSAMDSSCIIAGNGQQFVEREYAVASWNGSADWRPRGTNDADQSANSTTAAVTAAPSTASATDSGSSASE